MIISEDVIGLLIITLILLAMLIPLAFLSGKKKLCRDATSGLRSALTVVQAGMVLAIIFGVFEMGYSSIVYYNSLANGYDDVRIDFLRYAETVLVSLYWIVVLVTEFLNRKKEKLRLKIVYPVAVVALALICAGLAALVNANNNYYFDYTLYALIGVVIIGILHMTNMLLNFRSMWQRKVITVVNGAVFAIMVALVIMVIRIGTAQTGTAIDTEFLLSISTIVIFFLLPSIICIGTVIAEHIKED